MLSGATASIDVAGRDLTIETRRVPTRSLQAIVESAARDVDVLFVDVEGHELSVLQSLDWTGPRPRIVVLENFGIIARQETIRTFMKRAGYRFHARIWIVDDVFVADDWGPGTGQTDAGRWPGGHA